MANRELSKQDYLNKAEAYCARAEHCAAEVRRKLYEWGAPDEINDEIVETLYANTFLNDERFCRAYVHDKLEIQHWGRMKIHAGLSALQIPESIISAVLKEINQTRYLSVLRKVAQQRQPVTKDQLCRFLLQRGFTYDEIAQFLKY